MNCAFLNKFENIVAIFMAVENAPNRVEWDAT